MAARPKTEDISLGNAFVHLPHTALNGKGRGWQAQANSYADTAALFQSLGGVGGTVAIFRRAN
jgi:hypothetical protein